MNNAIKGILVFIHFAFLTASGQNNNELITETRTSASFQFVSIRGELNVRIVPGKIPSVTVEGTFSEIENIISYVRNDTLIVFEANSRKMNKKTDVF